jgi:Rrf2 family iron-sulfur cluster assembly transcriptional regulator
MMLLSSFFLISKSSLIKTVPNEEHMLSLSQTTGYAIKAMSYLRHDRACLIREVAEVTGIGKPYLAKIFNLLVNKGLVLGKRGHRGGILLARPAADIVLLEIVYAIEGDSWSRRCLLGMRECDPNNLCPTHDLWMQMKEQIRDSLARITLAEVSNLSENQHWALGLPRQGRAGVENEHR